ncbi:MAG: sulfatase [Saprospiraceae bacterium]|nr:sulfatase [Saprospiraceae bacterium]
MSCLIRLSIVLFIGCLPLTTMAQVPPQRPNIVILFVDDLGWNDLGYRNPKFHTPNIDQLRADGFEFTRAYIPTPTCSPSRVSLLTGKEAVRIQMVRHISGDPESEFSLWPSDPVQLPSRNWMPLEEITYAERLKEFGYYNQFIGKWHLGHEPYHPIHQGFDAQFGTGNHGHPGNYYSPFFKTLDPLKEAAQEAYLTDVLTVHAESFIQEYDKLQPFLLSLWYYNVHGPHIGREDFVKRYTREGLKGKEAEYAAMVSTVDESVGRVRQVIKDRGMADRTIIIFISDQGGYFDNPPFRGGKRGGETLCEGGARVPLLIYYPGLNLAPKTSAVPVQSLDIYPTLVEIASGKKCKDRHVDGKSLLPVLNGKKMRKRDLFFFRSYEDQYAAIISGDWKLIKYHSGKFELFNISTDIAEAKNLIGQRYRQEVTLKKRLSRWEKVATADHQLSYD